MVVTFNPSIVGPTNGTLTVMSNALNGIVEVRLRGSAHQGKLSMKPKSIHFGTLRAGKSAVKSVRLYNPNPIPMNIRAITSSEPAQFQVSGCTGPLDSGAGCSVSVTFSPDLRGRHTATLSIVDDALGSPQSIELTGRAE